MFNYEKNSENANAFLQIVKDYANYTYNPNKKVTTQKYFDFSDPKNYENGWGRNFYISEWQNNKIKNLCEDFGTMYSKNRVKFFDKFDEFCEKCAISNKEDKLKELHNYEHLAEFTYEDGTKIPERTFENFRIPSEDYLQKLYNKQLENRSYENYKYQQKVENWLDLNTAIMQAVFYNIKFYKNFAMPSSEA